MTANNLFYAAAHCLSAALEVVVARRQPAACQTSVERASSRKAQSSKSNHEMMISAYFRRRIVA
jgi:hypothetical protein